LNQFVSIAKITKTHGVCGEVTAILLTDFPERFCRLREVRLFSAEASYWEEIERFRFHKKRVILKFRGRERPHEVQELLNCEVQVPESDRVELPEDTYFDSDLEGCRIFAGEQLLGEVVELLKSGGSPVNLVIATPDGREFMVPLVKEFVKEVDVRRARIRVELPPGLEELAVDRRKKG
jgi:16S rRNA processing protein RimM